LALVTLCARTHQLAPSLLTQLTPFPLRGEDLQLWAQFRTSEVPDSSTLGNTRHFAKIAEFDSEGEITSEM